MAPVVNIASIDAWIPTIIAFAVMSGAINGVMAMLKKSVAKSALSNHYIFKRALPWFPAIIGIVGSLLVGDSVTPIQFHWALNAAAGLLMGALSSNIYSVWTAQVDHVKEVRISPTPPPAPSALPEGDSSGSSDMISVDESDGGEFE
jgi:uncharacterized membrane protein